ncbi:MAG: hypothetical protein IVW52_07365 [Acidimicrobiales bacterium]|nr:hypothetical protein [Acidimicrobiales bacterium]
MSAQSGEGPGATTALAPGGGAVPLLSTSSVDITAPEATDAESGPAAVEGGAQAAAPATAPGPRRAELRRAAKRRSGHRWRWWLALAVALSLGLATVGWFGAQRINRPLVQPSQLSALPSSVAVPGSGPALPWPAKGQGAISVPALGYTQQSGPESPLPIASLTKMTSAVVVLRDHPMAAGSSGPPITITAADVAEYDTELRNDQSTVPIRTGEVLTEEQMLEALVTQSANDIAYALALWDAGGVPAFVAKMNALAQSLGATSTHYVDASGYDPHTVSTAADCLRVAAAGMSDPTFARVVGMRSVTLPLVGTIPNVVTEIGSNNVVGIKSGYTTAAGGCMVLAADRVIQGRSVTVLVAVLAQPVPPPTIPKPAPTTTTTTAPPPPPATTAPPAAPGAVVPPTTAPPPTTTTTPPPTTTTTTIPLDDLPVVDPLRYTRPVVEGLLTATESAIVPITVATRGQLVGTVITHWGGGAHRVGVVTSAGAFLFGWPGQRVVSGTKLLAVPAGGAGGRRVGTALYALGGQFQTVPMTLSATVPEPSWWWRLVHN